MHRPGCSQLETEAYGKVFFLGGRFDIGIPLSFPSLVRLCHWYIIHVPKL